MYDYSKDQRYRSATAGYLVDFKSSIVIYALRMQAAADTAGNSVLA